MESQRIDVKIEKLTFDGKHFSKQFSTTGKQ